MTTSDNKSAPFLKPGETVVLFDGVCKLCNGSARFIIEHDHQRRIKLATVQTPQGQALLAWAAMPLDHFDTMAVIRDNQLFVRSDGFLAIVGDFSAHWRWLRLARFIPRSWRDWVYDRIARNRYRLFGRYDACLMPLPEHERRYLKVPPGSLTEPR